MVGQGQALARSEGDTGRKDALPKHDTPISRSGNIINSVRHASFAALTEVLSEEKEEEENKREHKKKSNRTSTSSVFLLSQRVQFVSRHTPAQHAFSRHISPNTSESLYLFIEVIRI